MYICTSVFVSFKTYRIFNNTGSSLSETSSKSNSSQPSSRSLSPETTTSASSLWTTSPELLEMECSFNTLLAGTREKQGHAVMRSQMDNLQEQQQHIIILKQVAMQLQNQPRPVSAPPSANVSLPHILKDVQVTWGLGTRCRQRMSMVSIRTAVTHTPETDCKTLRRSHLKDALDHCMSRSRPSYSPHHLMSRTTATSTPGQDKRDSLSQKRREGVVKSDKHCNLTFKVKTWSLQDSAMFPRNIIVVFLLVFVVRS